MNSLSNKEKIRKIDDIIKNIKNNRYSYKFNGFNYEYSNEITEIIDVLSSDDYEMIFFENYNKHNKKELVLNIGSREYNIDECILCLNHLWHMEGSGLAGGIILKEIESGRYIYLLENFKKMIEKI